MSTLSEIITRLRREDPALTLPQGWTNPHSYRGYYNELAFEPTGPTTVADLLAACHEADGSTYEGWKGGDYTMDGDTEVHLAGEGSCGVELTVEWLDLVIDGAKQDTEIKRLRAQLDYVTNSVLYRRDTEILRLAAGADSRRTDDSPWWIWVQQHPDTGVAIAPALYATRALAEQDYEHVTDPQTWALWVARPVMTATPAVAPEES